MISYYLKFWALDQPVFNRCLSPGVCFIAQRHQRIRDHFQILSQQAYTIQTVTAPDGYGKSTLMRWLRHELSPQQTECYSLNLEKTASESGWLIPHLARYLCGESRADESSLGHLSRGLDQLKKEKRSLLLLLDSCENLSGPEACSEIPGLHNLSYLAGVPLSIVLAGSLEMMPALNEISFFNEKSSLHWTLSPLSRKETEMYIKWYYYQAQFKQNPFPEPSIDALHHHSSGIPSRLNNLAENCLIGAALRKRKLITPEMVEQSSRMMNTQNQPALSSPGLLQPPQPPASKALPIQESVSVSMKLKQPFQDSQEESGPEPGISLFDDP